MTQMVFQDDFRADAPGEYPANWRVERNCERVNNLGRAEEDGFSLLFTGNKHIPRTPPLRNFTLVFDCAGDAFFSRMSIRIFFRYDGTTGTGFCVEYTWGLHRTRSHYAQVLTPEYTAALYRYEGTRSQGKFTELASATTEAFVDDLAATRTFELCVRDSSVLLKHDGRTVLQCEHRVLGAKDEVRRGVIALDRGPQNGRMILRNVRVMSSDRLPAPRPLWPNKHIEFPRHPHGMLSPYRYHISGAEWAGMTVLNIRLTGGPSPTPRFPDIDRFRFNEKLFDPYVRIERADGSTIGKFYLFRGSVGLAAYHWNVACSVMLPADTECPVQREVKIDALPSDARFIIGYESYVAEDSITLAGGPAEALLDDRGDVIHAGAPLLPGTVTLHLSPAGERSMPTRIPEDLPMAQEARAFAEHNFFYVESEAVEMQARVWRRDGPPLPSTSWTLSVNLENVFKEPLGEPQICPLLPASVPSIRENSGVSAFSAPIRFTGLKNGVYHVHSQLRVGELMLAEVRHAFEVLSDDPDAPCPPVASGLPRLHPNILSGIENNHFHPWSPSVVDTAHYNSGGNNYFKVAKPWRAWDALHVYRRQWLYFLWSRFFDDTRLEVNQKEITSADACLNTRHRLDLWGIDNYRDPDVFNALLEFVQRDAFVSEPNAALTGTALARQDPAQGITAAQFRELVERHWKAWILHFSKVVTERLTPDMYRGIKTLNPNCQPFEFCPVYPTYASVYKAGYFPLYFGKDLRAGLHRWLPGPNGFEDYPYSSGYAIARGIYQLASCKLECPGLKLYPEMFGINGETRDSRVVYANPPYGRSDPPPGFFTKQFYEYSFATTWFDRRGFHFWRDHGYYPKTWDRENYDEMLAAYAFISRVTPHHPMRTGAFAFSRAACMAHPDHFEWDEEEFRNGHMMNTAEEAVAFAYEQARAAGCQAGFVFRLEDVERLNPRDVGLLILPPLCGVSAEELSAIRSLHRAGVNLVGFEDCTGLEDLFGVTRKSGDAARVTEIRVDTAGQDFFPELKGLQETTTHPLCRCAYSAAEADVLLVGNDGTPVLVTRSTPHGQTAFFALPPTVVRRAQARVPSYGQESISEIINRATAAVLARLSDNFVETTAGKTLAFRDTDGAIHVLVEEDTWPQPARPIAPVITIKEHGLQAEDIQCAQPHTLVEVREDRLKIMLHLNTNQTAWIHLRNRDR